MALSLSAAKHMPLPRFPSQSVGSSLSSSFLGRQNILRSQCGASIGCYQKPLFRIQKARAFSFTIRRRDNPAASSEILSNTQPNTTTTPPSQTTEPLSPNPQPKSRLRSVLTFLVISLTAFSATFIMTASPALKTATEVLDPPTDEETLILFTPDPTTPEGKVNTFILNHPLVRQYSNDERFIASRPHLKIPPSMRPHNFTGGTLLGGDMIVVPPLTFSTEDGTDFVSFMYLGKDMCGHPGIVHGGLLATLMDEGLARCCFNALPHKVGVTASLTINYRRPCMAGQYVVLKAKTTKVDGRKAWVEGKLMSLREYADEKDEKSLLDGDVFVESEALFVEPKQAATMAKIYSTSSTPRPKTNGEHQTQPGPSG